MFAFPMDHKGKGGTDIVPSVPGLLTLARMFSPVIVFKLCCTLKAPEILEYMWPTLTPARPDLTGAISCVLRSPFHKLPR